jgi:hypothetical protein
VGCMSPLRLRTCTESHETGQHAPLLYALHVSARTTRLERLGTVVHLLAGQQDGFNATAARRKEKLRKQSAIQALLVRLQPDEVYVVIRIILQSHHAISLSLDTFLTWMHPSAASVLQT